MVSKVVIILACAAALAVGIMLNVIACAIAWPGHPSGVSWYSMFSILFYVLSPLPVLACGKTGMDDPFSEGTTTLADVAFVLTGILVTCGFGLPALLTRAGVIAWQTMLLSIAGGLVTYTAVIFFVKYQLTDNSQEMSAW